MHATKQFCVTHPFQSQAAWHSAAVGVQLKWVPSMAPIACWKKVLRTDPHENLIQNWDVASASEGYGSFPLFQPDGRTRLQLMCCAHRQSQSFNFLRPLSQGSRLGLEGEYGYDLSQYQN